MILQDGNFKNCLSLFGWEEKILYNVRIVHWSKNAGKLWQDCSKITAKLYIKCSQISASSCHPFFCLFSLFCILCTAPVPACSRQCLEVDSFECQIYELITGKVGNINWFFTDIITFQNCAIFGSDGNSIDYDEYVDGVGDKHISWYNTLVSWSLAWPPSLSLYVAPPPPPPILPLTTPYHYSSMPGWIPLKAQYSTTYDAHDYCVYNLRWMVQHGIALIRMANLR